MTTRITDILLITGPMLSGDLKNVLVRDHRLTDEAARKRISRALASKKVWRYSGFFTDNQSFLFLPEQKTDVDFFDKLRLALAKAAKRLYSIVVALEYHHGYLDEKEIGAYSMSPIRSLKGHRRLDTILKLMEENGWISKSDNQYSLNRLIAEQCSFNSRHSDAVRIAKQILLMQFQDWARSLGFISYEKGRLHSEFGKFQWAFTGPSYTFNLKQVEKGKVIPGFVLGDVLIGNVIEVDDVSFFLEKLQAVSSIPKASRLLPILLVENISGQALQLLRKRGVIVGFIDQIFGQSYTELLRSLINLVTNAGAILKKDPEAFISLMEGIEKLAAGKTNNIRGDLFELAVGYYYSYTCQTLDIGLKINFEGEKREIDVSAKTGKTVYIAECKGYNYPVDREMVDEWLGKNIPIIRKWLLQQSDYSNWNIIFEIWSTGGFTEDALELLKERAAKTKPTKYQINYFGKEEIVAKANELRSKKFSDILREYFIREHV